MSLRLFIGLELPHNAVDRLTTLQNGVPDARWVAPENLHLTLRFVGDTPEPQLSDLVNALEMIESKSFNLILSGVGSFGRRKPRALWVGTQSNPDLTHLQEKVERAVQSAGFEPETRKFSPHVTLARLKNTKPSKVVPYLEANGHFTHPAFEVRHFSLYSSILGRGGSTYHVEHRISLKGSSGPSEVPVV